MSNPIISVENLSKKYVIGENIHGSGARTFRDIFDHKMKKLFSKQEKQHKIEQTTLWALKNLSFEVNEGDIVGIIGRNGAGKSTLLKILARITEPTNGTIRLQGRVASLLEVGTGFNQELTGRENIYLNGAILGMRKAEINKKFDEIVAFAEVEKFIDTPVKRYSSGMYLRLAFAVAAHLEPDILIVDEVLAVGDVSFQKKCLGKMEDISKRGGRTVLFVSHNLGAVNQLCNKTLLLSEGKKINFGDTHTIIKQYLKTFASNGNLDKSNFIGPLVSKVEINKIIVNNFNENQEILLLPKDEIKIRFVGNNKEQILNYRIGMTIFSQGQKLFTLIKGNLSEDFSKGNFEVEFLIEKYLLRPGDYSVAAGIYSSKTQEWMYGMDLCLITIVEQWDEFCPQENEGIFNISTK